jgi:hypothetical protein
VNTDDHPLRARGDMGRPRYCRPFAVVYSAIAYGIITVRDGLVADLLMWLRGDR